MSTRRSDTFGGRRFDFCMLTTSCWHEGIKIAHYLLSKMRERAPGVTLEIFFTHEHIIISSSAFISTLNPHLSSHCYLSLSIHSLQYFTNEYRVPGPTVWIGWKMIELFRTTVREKKQPFYIIYYFIESSIYSAPSKWAQHRYETTPCTQQSLVAQLQ